MGLSQAGQKSEMKEMEDAVAGVAAEFMPPTDTANESSPHYVLNSDGRSVRDQNKLLSNPGEGARRSGLQAD